MSFKGRADIYESMQYDDTRHSRLYQIDVTQFFFLLAHEPVIMILVKIIFILIPVYLNFQIVLYILKTNILRIKHNLKKKKKN